MRKTVPGKSVTVQEKTNFLKIGVLHLTQANNLTLSTVVRTDRMPEAEVHERKSCVCSSAFNCEPLAVLVMTFLTVEWGCEEITELTFCLILLEYRFPEVEGNCDYSMQKFTSHFPSVAYENVTIAPYILSLIPYSLSPLSPKAKQNQRPPSPQINKYYGFSS